MSSRFHSNICMGNSASCVKITEFIGTPDKPGGKLKRRAGAREEVWMKMRKWERGIVSLVPCLFAGVPLCCLLFEPVTIKARRVQGRNKRVPI